MTRGNVLVIGNSGVGKSTLINAVLGENRAKTGWGGAEGTSKHLEIYESDDLPFRMIDSVGFEPNFIKRREAVNSVRRWSKRSAKEGNEDSRINLIWFCVDGTSSKLFESTIKSFIKATSIWESVPVVVVITKSYSEPDRVKNIEMVKNVLSKYSRFSYSMPKIVPVIADTYYINDDLYAPPQGLSELTEITNELMPEGIKAAKNDVDRHIFKSKRVMAHSIVGGATVAGVGVGAVPIPLADAAILTPIEVAEINAIMKIYNIKDMNNADKLVKSIVEAGTVSVAAKSAVSTLKAIPGINLGAILVNSLIAGTFVAMIGEATIYISEQVYLGKKTVDDIDWVKKVIESKLASELVERFKEMVKDTKKNDGKKAVVKSIIKAIFGK